MTTSIKLYGMKADRFEQIKADLTVQLGYEPSNPEVIGLLMGSFDEDELPAFIERSDRSVESKLLDDPEN